MIAVVVAAFVFGAAALAIIPVIVGWFRDESRRAADARVAEAIKAGQLQLEQMKTRQLTADLELANAHEKVLQEVAGEASARPISPGTGMSSLRQGLREAARARAAATAGTADRPAAAGAVPANPAAGAAAPGPVAGGGVPGGRT